MIKLLIVDDDTRKLAKIVQSISGFVQRGQLQFEAAVDMHGARKSLSQSRYDLLILDLNLPESIGCDPNPKGGSKLLKELRTAKRLLKPPHIIGITAFEEAIVASSDDFGDSLWCIIKYEDETQNWANQLVDKLDYLIQCQNEASVQLSAGFDYDVAILTALHVPELQAVRNLPIEWRSIKQPGDSIEYLVGSVCSVKGPLKVVAASSSQMGMPAASVLAMKMIGYFRPRFLVMVGIAAGIRGENNLGDLLVAEQSWDYNSGKVSKSKASETFLPDPRIVPLDPHLRDCLSTIRAKRTFLDSIKNSWPGIAPDNSINLHVGPIVSGSAVVQSTELIRKIKAQNRKIIGLEMETYGVFFAAANCSEPRPLPLAIKSVCDFADEKKGDKYQAYSAFVSANFVHQFMINELPEIALAKWPLSN